MDDSSLAASRSTRFVAVAMKCVPLRADVDPLTGGVCVDARFAGPSPADEAALEIALRYAERIDARVLVASVANQTADSMLLGAVACGADRALRIDPGLDGEQASSSEVARALAAVFADAVMVFCGDWSLDRGSGSVPALVAHFMKIDQALGVVAIGPVAHHAGDQFDVERRLDGGRREALRVSGPSVISVEGAAASLRRANIADVVRATSAAVEVLTRPMDGAVPGIAVERVVGHRPAAGPIVAVNAPSAHQRVSQVLGIGSERTPPLRLTLEPDEAARTILDRLRLWGVSLPDC